MDFRRNQEDMVGFNPQIRASAFSKPLLPPTASLLSSPRGVSAAGGSGGGVPARNNGVGSTATSDVFDPAPAVEHHHPLRSNPDSDLAPAAAVSDGLLNAVAAATPTTLTGSSTSATTKDSSPPGEPAAKYRECLRNHAASLGGHVLDGCGDFMPGGAAASGGGGDPLKCAACGCHRSFHRKEVEGEHSYFGRYGNGASPHQQAAGRGRLPLLLPPPPLHHHPPPQQWLARSPSGAAAAFGGNYSGSGGATTESSSEEHPGGPPPAAAPGAVSRKRFRSKFTTEQKKRMLGFAESVGWRMQKQDEAAVEQFCAEVGVRRQVLKVWMHNNKHTMRKQQQQYHDHPQPEQQPLQIQEHHQQQQHRPQLQLQQHTQPQQQQHTQPQQQHRPQLQPQPQQHTHPQQQHTQPQQQQHRPQLQQQHPQQQHPHHSQQ